MIVEKEIDRGIVGALRMKSRTSSESNASSDGALPFFVTAIQKNVGRMPRPCPRQWHFQDAQAHMQRL